MIKRMVMLAVVVACSTLIYAQGQIPLGTKSKKARKAYEAAMGFYASRQYGQVINSLQDAIHADEAFLEAYLLLGDVYTDARDAVNARKAYEMAIMIDSAFFPNALFLLGNLEFADGLYQKARQHIQSYIFTAKPVGEKAKACERKILCCDFSLHAMAHPVPFEPENLGDSINTADDEYVNAITTDAAALFLTRKLPKQNMAAGRIVLEEDFYRTVMHDGYWRMARPIGPPVNTGGNEGALCISPDGMHLFFSGCNRPDGEGSCDLYHATRQGTAWSVPENIGPPVNTAKWESQPSLSSDGKTLFFVSNRSGGFGNSDIWTSTLTEDGRWGDPVNLGSGVNTPYSEMNPCIHPDGNTLYFASSGHIGMGGYDLFVARRDKQGNWKTPVNLGYPINSNSDEINMIVDASGEWAYFSSDKLGGAGKNDIYRFGLYAEARPELVTYVKGKVYNSKTRRPLEVRFQLIDLGSGEVVVSSMSDPVDGEFLVSLPSGKEYALHVSKEAYLFYSEHFSLTTSNNKFLPFTMDVPLQPIDTGAIVLMNNIFFETGKAVLLPPSQSELDRLASLLEGNPGLHIEIRGHTDNVGPADYNLRLSDDRAKVVYEYLIRKGIQSARLTYLGFGAGKPIADNTQEEGRSRNRRTEFRVTEK